MELVETLEQLVDIFCRRSLESYDVERAKEIRMMVAEYQHELFIRRFVNESTSTDNH